MYANVVIGVNGLSRDRDAIALAEALAPVGASRALVNVHLVGTVTLGATELSHELLQRQRRAYAEDADMISIAAMSVGEGLGQVAEDRGADLIVVGSCHRGPAGRLLAGNDVSSALHQAPCVVAVAPAGYGERPAAIRTIGVAFDESRPSEVGLAHGALLAAERGAKLRVCEVIEPRIYGNAGWAWGSAVMEDPERLAAAARERIGPVPGAEVEVVVGLIRIDLAEASRHLDLMVCGSRHLGPTKRLVLGSTSDYLSRHAHCPLLVTPASDEARVAAWHELRDSAAV